MPDMRGRRSARAIGAWQGRSVLARATVCAATLVAVLCLLWQSLLIQTHIHASLHTVAPSAAGSAPLRAVVRDVQGGPDDAANCPICQERAHSGAFLLPQAIAATPSTTAAIEPGSVATLAPMRTTRSHAWQSRAPPLPLRV